MRIQTSNRLAHLQVELNETSEQTYMLQSRQGHLYNEIQVLERYLAVNNGDLKSRSMYRDKVREFKKLQTQINRNNRRMITLRHQISIEYSKIQRGR